MSIFVNIRFINRFSFPIKKAGLLLLFYVLCLPIIAQRKDIKTVSGDCENGDALVIYKNGDRYDGFFKDSLYEGQGMLRLKSKEYYEGAFSKGLYDGAGYLQLPNKDVYEGSFKAGLYDGNGTLTEYKGRTYTGSFLKGKMNGSGSISLPNGDKYIGSFKNDEIDGYGEYYSQGYLTNGLFRKSKLINGKIVNLETQEFVTFTKGKPDSSVENFPDSVSSGVRKLTIVNVIPKK
ncbi:MAG: hypothetical protein PHI48_01225 [Bacteroidales bacterium]|nr:hypothetical protein [Bacteroidales bacterium]